MFRFCAHDREEVIWVEGGSKSQRTNQHINQYTQRTLQIIRLLIAEEVAHHNNGESQDNDIKGLETEIHPLIESPSDKDDQRGVEERGLDGGAEDVGQGEIHLVVPCLVDRCQVLREFFDHGDEDETHEAVGNVALYDDVVDLVDCGMSERVITWGEFMLPVW